MKRHVSQYESILFAPCNMAAESISKKVFVKKLVTRHIMVLMCCLSECYGVTSWFCNSSRPETAGLAWRVGISTRHTLMLCKSEGYVLMWRVMSFLRKIITLYIPALGWLHAGQHLFLVGYSPCYRCCRLTLCAIVCYLFLRCRMLNDWC